MFSRFVLIFATALSFTACAAWPSATVAVAVPTAPAAHRAIHGTLLYQPSQGTASSTAAPTANTVLATSAALAQGLWQVDVTAFQSGTVDAATLANIRLQHGQAGPGFINDAIVMSAGSVAGRSYRIQVADGDTIRLIAIATAAGGSVYNVELNVRPAISGI